MRSKDKPRNINRVDVLHWLHVSFGSHLADPGAQQADAHLAVVVQVGVEAAAALRQVAEQRRHRRVDVWQLDVKQEEAVLVRRARGPLDQS